MLQKLVNMQLLHNSNRYVLYSKFTVIPFNYLLPTEIYQKALQKGFIV